MESLYPEQQWKEPFLAALKKIGVFRLAEDYGRFIRQGKEMLSAAGTGDAGFARDPSCLSINTPQLDRDALTLIVDIGGSHTKAGVCRRAANGNQRWQTLFDFDNVEFDEAGPGLPIERFARALAAKITQSLQRRRLAVEQVEGVGVIWSNAVKSIRLPAGAGRTAGVSALITGIGTGKSYRKGEFFISGLSDGYDLGSVFIRTLGDAGLTPRVFVIGNDTVFTLKATRGADAGMVASTGANATDVDADGLIYNTEMGGLFSMDPALLSEGDSILDKDREGVEPVKLEDLIAGKWLPRIFEGHIIALAANGIKELKPLAEYLQQNSGAKSGVFDGRDLTVLLESRSSSPGRLIDLGFEKLAPYLKELCAVLVNRAGKLAAGMGYLSLHNQLQRKDRVVLSLDSTQALYLPGYLASMERELAGLVGPSKKATIVLQKPQLEITVPMKGLAEALAGELAGSGG